MYAIIKSGSRQYQVKPELEIQVNRLDLEEGAAFETDQVLLYNNADKDIRVGTPFVKGAKVKGIVVRHLRGPKLLAFKMRRREHYRKIRGHRQDLTRIRIESIEVA